jgi:2-hydroxy-3-oxopropionate reductase
MKTIGFIGLGIMGGPMAANLVRAGYSVTGYDLGDERLERLTRQGGHVATGVADAVAGADAVITMLPDSPDVEAVALGPDGLLAHAEAGSLYLDMSTVRPDTARLIALAAGGERARRPVLVEVMVEREANAAMGPSLDAITEFEPAPEPVSLSGQSHTVWSTP